MRTLLNYNDDYSHSYREQLSKAILQSKGLGFTRPALISECTCISDDTLNKAEELLRELTPILNNILPSYWGNSCQTLATFFFAYLNSRNIAADIVLGNVIIHGNDEFEVTLESLQAEVISTSPLTGDQAVHAWVSLGDDTIIDAALPQRLVKYYKAPREFDVMTVIGRASEMSSNYQLRYQPILVGTEFFAKTNTSDPIDLLNAFKQQMRP